MSQPLISVVIPVFNGERFLAAAIDSVLAQDIREVEIIVINDGSTDGTKSVARSYGEQIVYLSQDNQGPSAARNRGIRHARGEFLSFLDCDDCWMPDNLVTLLRALNDDVDIALGQIQEERFDESSQCWVPTRGLTFSPSLAAMLTRKSTFEAVGMLDASIRIGEDKDWFYRAREKNMTIKYLNNHIAQHHRRHDDNMTIGMPPPEHNLLSLMRRSLQRKGVFK